MGVFNIPITVPYNTYLELSAEKYELEVNEFDRLCGPYWEIHNDKSYELVFPELRILVDNNEAEVIVNGMVFQDRWEQICEVADKLKLKLDPVETINYEDWLEEEITYLNEERFN
jgi:hypothetical protein